MFRPQESPKKNSGFTLIELLVVISIIAILSAIGLVSYNNIRKNSLTAKYKSDLNAIKKAYESNYDPTLGGGQGGYKPLTGANFANGSIPTPTGGTSSYLVSAPDASATINNTQGSGSSAYGPNFSACVNTNDGSSCSSPSASCSCVSSNQGVPITSPTGGVNPTCDQFGTLTNSTLVGYWNMNSGWTDVSGHSNDLAATGTTSGAGLFGNGAVMVNSASDAQYLSKTGLTGASTLSTGNADFTVTAWVKFNSLCIASGNPAGCTRATNRPMIVTKDSGIAGGREFDLMYDTNTFSFRIFHNGIGTGSPASPIASGGAAVTGTWYFVAGRFNSVNKNIYVSFGTAGLNNLVTSPRSTIVGGITVTPLATSTDFNVGKKVFGNNLDGRIDDVRFYKKFLSDNEINSLFNLGAGCVPN